MFNLILSKKVLHHSIERIKKCADVIDNVFKGRNAHTCICNDKECEVQGTVCC